MSAQPAYEHDGVLAPSPSTPVLLNRPVRPDVDPASVSRYASDVWDLTPGVFEPHSPRITMNFGHYPPAFRGVGKNIAWLLINADVPALRWGNSTKLSLPSVVGADRHLRQFLFWLDDAGVTAVGDVDDARLWDYVTAVKEATVPIQAKWSAP